MSPKPDPLNAVFSALSDPTRRAILARLTSGACSVTELGEPHQVSAPAISKHLRVLERAGLITRWKTGRVNYCRLMTEPLDEVRGWIEQHQAFWEQQLDAVAEYLSNEDSVCLNGSPPRPASRSGPGASSRRPAKGSSTRGRRRRS